MRRWWKASAASYFNHVSKATTLAAVTEAAGANAAAPLAGLKKDGVTAGAEQALAATGWLPRCLRTPPQRSETGRARLDGEDPEAEPGGEPQDEETLDEGGR